MSKVLVTGGAGLHDPKQRQPDIALARAELGWEPKVTFTEMIEAMVDADVARHTSRARQRGEEARAEIAR